LPHSYTLSLHHCVWSTKNREPWLADRDARERVFAGIGGVARENDMKALTVGGWHDHVHVLLSLKATTSVSDALRTLKAKSSQFIHLNLPELRRFAWQEGYGAFTIGVSAVDETKRYIETQEEHHRTRTFQEEFVAFLGRNGLEHDEKYIWR
jgi:putative transposase